MIRYLQQKDHYSCGPHSIINAMKWAGHEATKKNYFKKICKMCECSPKLGGASMENLDLALQHFQKKGMFKVCFRYVSPSIKMIDEQLAKGRAVLLKYRHGEPKGGGHYTLCVGKTESGRYILVNDKIGRTTTARTRKKMVKKLRTVENWKRVSFDLTETYWTTSMIWVLEKV